MPGKAADKSARAAIKRVATRRVAAKPVLLAGGNPQIAKADGNAPVLLVLDRTPFYGEAGGQVGDTGTIRGERFTFEVTDTKKDNDFTLHVGRVKEGTVTVNDQVSAQVDATRRAAIRRAHSATHVLHHALHIHLGKHAQQAGSKVEPDRLRFDFANPEAVGRERLRGSSWRRTRDLGGEDGWRSSVASGRRHIPRARA